MCICQLGHRVTARLIASDPGKPAIWTGHRAVFQHLNSIRVLRAPHEIPLSVLGSAGKPVIKPWCAAAAAPESSGRIASYGEALPIAYLQVVGWDVANETVSVVEPVGKRPLGGFTSVIAV